MVSEPRHAELRLCSLRSLVGNCSNPKNAGSFGARVMELEGIVRTENHRELFSVESRLRSQEWV